MNAEFWLIIVNINNTLKPLRETTLPERFSMTNLLELRSKLRTQLEALRSAISTHFSERDAYQLLFPLTAHCDEIVKKIIADSQPLDWPPLQQELYQVSDAGNLFFDFLDSALNKPETLLMVYEVYYFCLQDGFCGRYSGHPERLHEYRLKLQKFMHIQPLTSVSQLLPETNKRVYFRIPNSAYYYAAGLFLVLVYVFLTNLASTWQPIQ